MNKDGTYKCPMCGKKFKSTQRRTEEKYCSLECFKAAYSNVPNPYAFKELWEGEGPQLHQFTDIEVKTLNGKTRMMRIHAQSIIVRPWTDKDAEILDHQKGRAGFSYGAHVCVLPSESLNRKDHPSNY